MTAPTIVIAPYAAPTAARRRWHTARASAIVRLLTAEGAPAVANHRAIDAGDYGDDADPEERARGLELSARIAAVFPRAFVLLRDDGTPSDGMRADFMAWCSAPSNWRTKAHRWSDLRDRFDAAGLLDLWAGLVKAPDVAGVWAKTPTPEWRRLYGCGSRAATVWQKMFGWSIYDADGHLLASGPETGAAGRAAADAALRARGIEVCDG